MWVCDTIGHCARWTCTPCVWTQYERKVTGKGFVYRISSVALLTQR